MTKQTVDIAIIGAGPSGMMSAIAAAELGASVLLIEKNKRLGRKLLLTGGGRCNVTNNRPVDDLIQYIPGNGRFLYSTFSQFNNQDIMTFFSENGVALKEEDHGRIFPTTDKAQTIVEALAHKLKELGVTVLTGQAVEKILFSEDKVEGLRLASGDIKVKAIVIATGGLTYPATGSTGDGYKFAKQVAHTVTPLYPTESPIKLGDPFIAQKTLQGLALQEVTLHVLNEKGKIISSQTMDLLFTHFGISGPAALRSSSFINQLLKKADQVALELDCYPEKSLTELEQALTELAATKKVSKNAFAKFLPERFMTYCLTLKGLAETPANQLSSQELAGLAALLKAFPLTATGSFGLEKSFVTGGGVHLKEIDPKTMHSKKKQGLFFAGEVIDVNGFTGGFNVTAALCTGHSAGTHAAQLALYDTMY
jgi:predicted Rossmann fold flavoprotein